MTTELVNTYGRITSSGARDSEGHRDYKVKFLVRGEIGDGPAQVFLTPGLPTLGAPYAIDNDLDLWAWCRPNATIQEHQPKEGEPSRFWTIECLFSTKPPDSDKQRCQDQQIEDPLLEPQKISGSSVRYTEEATVDRFGKAILTSSHEQIRGPQVEFDANRDTITIEQNVAVLDLPLLASLRDCVNDSVLWGFSRRCVKFSSYTWERKFHGLCYLYYTRRLIFETNSDTFDRDILDEGSKVLNGHWDSSTGNWTLDNIGGQAPNPSNPTHFIRAKDRNGENMRVVLNGRGQPIDVNTRGAITSVTESNPAQIYCHSAHGLVTGDQVSITGVDEPSIVNDVWTVTVINSTVFSLNGSDTVGEPLYTSGGIWTKIGANTEGSIHVEKYSEGNLLLLGIPITF
jgi:hypothetical protein